MFDRPDVLPVDWTFSGPQDGDVVFGVRTAASWAGAAAVVHAGPGGDCQPCAYVGGNYGGAPEGTPTAGIEFELGCAVEGPGPAWAGVRLHLSGPVQDLGGGDEDWLDVWSPVQLPAVDGGALACAVGDPLRAPETAAGLVGAHATESGATFVHRIDLGRIYVEAGLPSTAFLGLFEVELDVWAAPGSSAWIELGRVYSDGCR